MANVSHELKTPMGALGLLAETLVSEPDPEVAQRLAGRIHNEAFRVSRIIDDLLDLSRIESEEAPPREPVLVNLVMADAIERVRATADQRGIEIVLHEPSPPVAVMGDRRQLVSAMHALLENAITYSYDNSKVVVTGTVQRANPSLGPLSGVMSSGVGPMVVEGIASSRTGEIPMITGQHPAITGDVPAVSSRGPSMGDDVVTLGVEGCRPRDQERADSGPGAPERREPSRRARWSRSSPQRSSISTRLRTGPPPRPVWRPAPRRHRRSSQRVTRRGRVRRTRRR